MQYLSLSTQAIGLGAAILVCSALTTAQSSQTPTQSTRPQISVLAAPQTVLQGFHTAKATMHDLSLPKTNVAGFEVDVSLGGKVFTLVLREHDVRAANYKLVVADQNGLHVVPTPANTTYRGAVQGVPDSVIAASLVDGQLTAMIQMDATEAPWNVQPLSTVVPGANPATHVMHFGGDNTVPKQTCGVNAVATHSPPIGLSNATIYECEIACDADFEEYKRHGSNVTATQNDVASIINACTVIYKRDVSIEYVITQTIVRTVQTYTTNDYSALLTQYRNRWTSNHGGVHRDLSHLFTAKSRTSGVIGVAYLSSVCSTGIGYGLSFTHFTSNFSSRVGLTAHEMGHSFGANHCSGSSCYIMCAGLGGCGRNVTKFGTASISAITSFRNSRTCLKKVNGDEPVLTSITPGTVDAFRGGLVTLNGSKFTGAFRVRVGGATLSVGTDPQRHFAVVSDTKITFQAPTVSSLATTQVTVESTKGVSLPMPLNYRETNPVLLDATVDAVRNQPFICEFGGGVANLYFLIASPTANTIQFKGETWLSQQIILKSGVLNLAGYGAMVLPFVPSTTPVGLKLWTQVVTIGGTPADFQGNSNIVVSTVK